MTDNKDRKKEVSARGIFIDKERKILLVKIRNQEKNHAVHWVTPGGRLESGESPRGGFRREIMEEVGLNWSDFKLRAIDYISGEVYGGTNGAICFMFYCGVIDDETKKKIVLQDSELLDYGFFSLAEAEKIMSGRGFRRLKEAISANKSNEVYY